jgi:hypothetical protein
MTLSEQHNKNIKIEMVVARQCCGFTVSLDASPPPRRALITK